jgi:glycerol-3-phosphate dehydrogenase (NAD(P)+)
MRVAVIGAGSWGTTVAAIAARENPTVLWARREDLCESINASAENADYLPGHRLPYTLHAVSDLERPADGAEVIVMGVPSHGFREVFTELRPFLDPSLPVLTLTKGIEQDSLLRMTEIIRTVAPDHDDDRIGVLTGPNLAAEVMMGYPAAAVIAMNDEVAAADLQGVFMGPTFRVYRNTDVVGAELAGGLRELSLSRCRCVRLLQLVLSSARDSLPILSFRLT